MILCILTRSGYVETCQQAMLTWACDSSMVVPANAQSAEAALKSLANDLLLEYLEGWLGRSRRRWVHRRCATYGPEFEPEEFESWVYTELVRMDSCNDGFRRHNKAAAPGPDHWWPYISLTDLRELKPNQILDIQENFDKLVVLAIDPELIEDEEGRKHLQQYQKEYGIKYRKESGGFWTAEVDYQ